MKLPPSYAWLAREPGPRILLEALKVYGTAEQPGPGSNPSILGWAKKTGLDRIYRDDSIAWCGLAMAYIAMQAGWEPPLNPLGARNWLNFGTPVKTPKLGDVMVFWRGNPKGWSGHVGLYVGEDKDAFHILGGNQKDRVRIDRFPRGRFLGARRCPWRISQPKNVRRVFLNAEGGTSTNEA